MVLSWSLWWWTNKKNNNKKLHGKSEQYHLRLLHYDRRYNCRCAVEWLALQQSFPFAWKNALNGKANSKIKSMTKRLEQCAYISHGRACGRYGLIKTRNNLSLMILRWFFFFSGSASPILMVVFFFLLIRRFDWLVGRPVFRAEGALYSSTNWSI